MEKKLLSSIVHDSRAIVTVLERGIRSEIFEDENNAALFKVLLAYHNDYKSLPSQDIFDKYLVVVPIDDKIKSKLPVIYAEVCTEKPTDPVEATLDYLVKIYKTRTLRETLKKKADDIVPDKIDEIAESIGNDIVKITNFGKNEGSEGDYRNSGEKSKQLYHNAKKGGSKGVFYGWPSLDNITHGQPKKTLWILLGFAKVGKSAGLINMGNHVWRHGGPQGIGGNVVYFSAEMSKEVIERRLNALNANLPQDGLKKGYLALSDEQKYFNYLDSLQKQNSIFYIVDRGGMTTDYVGSRIAELQKVMRIDAVIVDYMSIIRTTNISNKSASNWEVEGQKAWDLHDIAKKLDVPMLTAHQSTGDKKNPVSKSKEIIRHLDLMLGIELVDPNQLELKSETIDLTATLMYARESGVNKFSLEASYSHCIMREPTATSSVIIAADGAENII